MHQINRIVFRRQIQNIHGIREIITFYADSRLGGGEVDIRILKYARTILQGHSVEFKHEHLCRIQVESGDRKTIYIYIYIYTMLYIYIQHIYIHGTIYIPHGPGIYIYIYPYPSPAIWGRGEPPVCVKPCFLREIYQYVVC